MSGEIFNTENKSKSLVIETSGLIKNLKKFYVWSDRFLLVFAFFALWEALPRIGIIDQAFLPAFSEVILTLINLTLSGKLFVHIGVSLQRSITGFGLALLVGIPLGVLMGWYNKFERYTDVFVQGLRNTSTLALLPVFILFLGIGETSKIAIIFFGAVWHILINTISGVKNVDPIYIKAAKSMGISDMELFRKIILPASVPSIVSGARLGAKTAILVVIAAEMIGAKSGLGFYIQNAQYNFMIPEMYAAILTLVILGLIVNYLLVWFEKKATYWKGDIDSAIIG
ncbi:MAG: ABC transporter permease [Candidatus Methanoperedens sp.]|nr:ABC transporter permease [Candidatus Methanoperedens sp.]